MPVYDFGAGGTESRWEPWWLTREEDMHSVLCSLTKRLREQDSARRERVLRWLRMYGNYAGSTSGLNLDDTRLRDNIIAENVDTVISEVTMQEPKAAFLVDGGDWTMRQAAKAREAIVDATFRDSGFYDGLGGYGKGRLAMRDSALTGQGVLIVRPDWHALRPTIGRVLPLELLVEEADGRRGEPRAIHLVAPYDRSVLAARYGASDKKLAKKLMDRSVVPRWIASQDGGVEDWLIQDSQDCDLVLVTESWRLPSHKGAKDGKHVAAVEGLTLECEQFDEPEFPVVWANWKPCPVGFYGIGLAQDLQADQVELNRTLIKIQDTIGAAAGMWLAPKGSKVNPRRITDLPGSFIEFTGSQPPQWYQPNSFPSDLIEHADRVRARARGRAGISEMASTGAKPGGLSSGEAIRSFRDQFSMRQSPHAAVYEALTVALAKRIVSCYERIYRALKDSDEELPPIAVEVKRGRRKVLKRLRWEETSMPANEAVISAYPMSALPNHPASRTQTVEEWLGAGLINQDEARSLLDFPDTEGAMNLALADQDYALFAFETMVEDGDYMPPEPYQRLDLAFELIRRAYLRARIDGAPEDNLDLVRQHLSELERLQKKAQAAAAPPPAPAAPANEMMPPDAALPSPDMQGVIETAPSDMVA